MVQKLKCSKTQQYGLENGLQIHKGKNDLLKWQSYVLLKRGIMGEACWIGFLAAHTSFLSLLNVTYSVHRYKVQGFPDLFPW